MKHKIIGIIISALISSLFTGCGADTPQYTAQQADFRARADRAVMADKQLTNLDDYKISVYTAPNGKTYVRYELELCGYYTGDSIQLSFLEDGTMEDITEYDSGYGIFVDRVSKLRLWWCKLRLAWYGLRYWDEPHYHLQISENGDLLLVVEIIDHFEPEPNENGETYGGCGYDHEHRFFHATLCDAP